MHNAEPLVDIVLYDPESCPCKRTECINHGNCTACMAKHHDRSKPTKCERLKAKQEKLHMKLERKESRKRK